MIRNIALVSLSALTLTACISTPDDHIATLPQITYNTLNAIPVNVSRIELDTQTQRGAQAWDVSNSVTTSPDTAMRRYLQKRFKANGQNGVLKFSLDKAEITSASVPNKNKILSFISLANVTDYTMEIVVNIDSAYHSGQPDYNTSTRFVRKTRMPVDVTLAYREARLQKTLEEMIRDIDDAMITTLSHKFNLITSNNIPARNIAVNTELPKHEGELDIFIDEVKGNVSKVKQSVKSNIFGDTTSIVPTDYNH
jgi:hypothetical protein